MEDAAESPVGVQGGMPAERVSLHLAVSGKAGDRVVRDRFQGGVVVVVVVVVVAAAVADIHTDPEKDSVVGVVVPAVEREEEAPVPSFVPCLGSTCPYLD